MVGEIEPVVYPPGAMASSEPKDRLLLLAFVLSGVAALGYELLWTRLLALTLGSETLGVLGVLAGFFGGLALGSVLFHHRARRTPAPVRLFVILELCAAGFAVISPHLLLLLAQELPPVLGPVAGDNDTPLALILSVSIAAVTLLPATVCMGATLPALVEARRRVATDDIDGSGLGRLYGANTLGATVGVIAAVHLILPAVGLGIGAVVLAGVGLLSALLAWIWNRRHAVPSTPAHEAHHPVVDTSADPDSDLLREPWLLYALAFGTGLAGVGLEVVGVQVLSQLLENTIYTFADILAVYLVGTAAGAWFYGRHTHRAVAGRPATVVAGLLVALAVSTVLAGAILASAPALLPALAPEGSTYARHLLAEGLLAALVFLPPTLLMGAAFSHVVGLIAPAGVGRAYALNTLGSALAPFVFGVWLIPRQGYTDAFYAVTFTYLLLFAVFAWFRRFKPSWILGGIAMGLVPFFLVAAVHEPRHLVLVEPDEDWETLELRETLMGLVVVSEHVPGRAAPGRALRRLQVGHHFRMGGAMAFGERRMGHIPLLLAPDAKDALFLGIGTGATLGAIRSYPLERIEAVELVPAVLDMLSYFGAINEEVLEDERLQLHSADARRYLAASTSSYDVIVADLFHPARDGAGSLYSRQHFINAREHLAPGGLFAQWLPLHQLDPYNLSVIVHTFLTVFPETHSFLGIYNVQTPAMVLIGRDPEPGNHLQIDLEALEAKLEQPIYGNLLMDDPRDLFGAYMLDRGALEGFSADAELNTDLDPRVLFDAPRTAYVDPDDLAWSSLVTLLPLRSPVPAELVQAPASRKTEFLAAAERFARALTLYLQGEVARVQVADSPRVPPEALGRYLEAYAVAPSFVPARGMLYQAARRSREAAEQVYPAMIEITPDEPRLYREYLRYLQRIGDRERFQAVLAEAQRRFPAAEGGESDASPSGDASENGD